jgi:antirestriction protein ArdC
MLRTYAVFNEDQIDGLPCQPNADLVDIDGADVNQIAEAFIAATNADIRIGGNKACYVPSHDFIALPPKHQFSSVEHFYATALHELVHFSGHARG